MVGLAGLFICLMDTTVVAQEVQVVENKTAPDSVQRGAMGDSPEDPESLLKSISERRAQKDALFSFGPLDRLNETIDQGKDDLYKATHLKLGWAFTHLFQFLSESPLAEDTNWGTASGMDFLGTWELVNRGRPSQGQLFFQVQGRWEYGTTGPERLGTVSLGSLGGTANTFSAYSPIFLLRNFYWQQGSEKAGWAYRIGKITPDAMFSTSVNITSLTTFLPTSGTGPFSNALTDSGLGIAAAWYINKNMKLFGVISDANANRYNWGDITAGDFYKAIEFAVKIFPRTSKSGYSKVTFWHTDATKDEQAVNGHLGPEGWGFFLKYEQELTADGRAIGILRYGKSFNKSAFYEEQFGAHFLLYDPTGITRLQNDLIGLAVNWVQAAVDGAQGETNVEIFYRIPILQQIDMTFSYQSVINPALDHNNKHASVYSIRFRMTI